MKDKQKLMEVKVERMIPATPLEAYEGWLDPNTPGTTWNISDECILHAEIDGLFYWKMGKHTPHYGRFTKMKKGALIQYTWMSPYTEGLESLVTVTFKKKGTETLMTLIHSGLPDSEKGRGHEGGWNFFLDVFPGQFKKGKKMSAKEFKAQVIARKKKLAK